ncbi:unnamed protein product [Closterium sp. Yama58-4]|nr:unnamed protein product [Closterium sp. Yama58-4]
MKLPLLEELSLFCPHQATELPGSFFHTRHLRTLVLDDASTLENPKFANLTALTTVCVTFPWNLLHLATLLRLPQLAHLTTFAPYQSIQPSTGAASIVLPACLKSLTFAVSCPPFGTIISPSASPFTGLKELLITNCTELTSLPDHIEDLLPRLCKLTIRECRSLVGLPESFASLGRLETLILYECGLLSLPSNFGHLPALKLLVLEFLPLSALPPSFICLTSLEALFLSECDKLLQLPVDFCQLTSLKALCISQCDFPLPDDIGALASLKDLRLCEYGQQFPASFTELLSLTSLEMNGSEDKFQLLEAAGEISSLRELKIYFSLVRTLPMSLFQLTGLQKLELSFFEALLELPSRLDMLVGLKTLELTDCEQLSAPPAGLPPSLEILCLGPFREGSSHVVDISHLTQLRVTCGPAGSSRLSCLEQLEQLEMRLEDDSQELPVPLTLICLPRLRSLLIKAPGIRSLPENMAAALPELRQLKLLSWSLEELPGSIVELTSLTSLTIKAPQMVALPEGMSRLTRLRKLKLKGCDALQHLPEFLTQLHQLILHRYSYSVALRLDTLLEAWTSL